MLFFQDPNIVNAIFSLNNELDWDGENGKEYDDDQSEEPFCLNYDTVFELTESDNSQVCKVLKMHSSHFSSLKL